MADVLTLRPATRADLSAVDALLTRSYPKLLAADYPPSVMVTAIPLIARARPELLASGTYWVAVEADGRIVGAGGWTPKGPGVGEVRHVVTAIDRTRRCIGRAVMERAIAQAREAGCRRLDCTASGTAVPFYATLGFRTLGPVNLTLRPGIVLPTVAMRRDG